MAPRFTISRITGEVTCHKPVTGEEILRLQKAILIRQTELHPEILREEGCGRERENT
jgi:hypothetical protein